jgi:hypothetical protein
MRNQAFYDTIFKDFWSTLDRSALQPDEHSMFGDAEVFDWLIATVRPEEIIEIGSWKGHSANHMADRCREAGLNSRIVCVDTWLGGPEHWLLEGSIETLHRKNGRPMIYDRFLGNTIARGNEGHIFPLSADSYAASEILKHLKFKADLIFVDAGHDPQSVTNDIMRYYPLLSETGVMWGDDYQDPPLANVVHECAGKLGVTVLVSARKWIYANEALMKRIALPNVQVRSGFEGWVHP